MDQNISEFMNNLRTKKCGGHFFDLLLMWPSIMLTKYIADPTYILENIDRMSFAFAEQLLMRTTASTERVCPLQHYSQVVAAYITLQTICSLTVWIIRLPRAHSNGEAFQDVKKPRYIIAKNSVLVFIMNILHYITIRKSVCKVYLRQKKIKLYTKSNFTFSFLSLFTILATEYKMLRD